MANEYAVNHADLKAVAKAIRDKGKTTESLTFPVDFISAVNAISGGGLNFDVVGGTMKPANPKENTILVKTEQEITGWIFSPTQPEVMPEGTVWIETVQQSSISFNALEENGIYIHLNKAKQVIGGVWEGVKFIVYRNGEWSKDEKVIYDGSWSDGLGFANTTGGGQNSSSYNNNANPIEVSAWGYTGVYVNQMIDVSGFKNLEVDMSLPSNCRWIYVSLSTDNQYYNDNTTTNAVAYKRLSGAMERQVVSIPIDSVQSGSYYIKFHGGQNANDQLWLTVYGIKLT